MVALTEALKHPDDWYVEYIEPSPWDFNVPITMKVTIDSAIAIMCSLHDYQNVGNREALQDFMAEHWGTLKNDKINSKDSK